MRIIARKMLKDFWHKHPQAEQPLKAWFSEASQADWKTPNEIKALYRSADFLPKNHVIFNIGGNKYRLIVQINYDFRVVYTKFVGTHAAYDRLKKEFFE